MKGKRKKVLEVCVRNLLLILCLFLFQRCPGTIFWGYVLTRPIADVRPDKIRISKKETHIDSLEGERIFEKYLEDQLVFWHEVDSYQVEIKADYESFSSKFFCPFPDNQMHMRLTYIPGNQKQVKGEILSGKRKGEVWELRNDTVFLHKTKGHTLVNPAGNPVNPIDRKRKTEYWMRFYGRMIELPLTFRQYELKSYIDSSYYGSEEYDRLLVSNDQGIRSREFDQYIVWLNTRTNLVDKVDLTQRELTKWLRGTLYFSDFQQITGVRIPDKIIMKTYKKKKPYMSAKRGEMTFYMKSGEVKQVKKDTLE